MFGIVLVRYLFLLEGLNMKVDPTAIIKAAATVGKNSAVSHSLSDGWNALLGDRIANFRLLQAAKIQEKTIAEFKRLGLKPNMDKIPERFAITWFEEATKQDEPEIQELFARLIAKAAAGDEDALDLRNIEIISKLTPHDAIVFQEFASGGWGAWPSSGRLTWQFNKRFYTREPTNVVLEKLGRSIEHLIAIGIFNLQVESSEKLLKSLNGNSRVKTSINTLLVLTLAGAAVYNAVKIDETSD